MPRGYHHLTYDARCQIFALKQSGASLSQIARQLEVDKSTVSREIKRNVGQKGYRFTQADACARERRIVASCHPRKMDSAMTLIIIEKLHEQWSPDQISGWLARHEPRHKISHESIYRYVWADKKSGGTLYKQLRHQGKKRNKRSDTKAGRGYIPNRVGIEERPEIVNAKTRAGDWEVDTIIGSKGNGGVIISMVDRASKLTKLAKVPRRCADMVTEGMVSKLSQTGGAVLTITADNGKEFANHRQVATALRAEFFFANPYSSWERGLNEHTNGLVRQYFPKGVSLEQVSQEELDRVESLLNSRPRKVLQYATPTEVFHRLGTTPPGTGFLS